MQILLDAGVTVEETVGNGFTITTLAEEVEVQTPLEETVTV